MLCRYHGCPASQTWVHRTYYDSPKLPAVLDIYESFVREVIQPQLNEPVIVYQKKPTFRYGQRSESKCAGFHCSTRGA